MHAHAYAHTRAHPRRPGLTVGLLLHRAPRESAPPQRVKEKHRTLLLANHPDTGGSTYIAGKVNEAKELLLNEKGSGSAL
jgi:hypothetical protein